VDSAAWNKPLAPNRDVEFAPLAVRAKW